MATRHGSGMPEGIDAARVASAPVARLATVRPDGTPHLVPVTFAVVENAVVTAIDSKPKRTTDLQRLRNIRAQPAVAFVVDHYGDDWTQLWWVRIDAHAEIVDAPDGRSELDALAAKYPQYQLNRPDGPVVRLRPQRWTSWSAGHD